MAARERAWEWGAVCRAVGVLGCRGRFVAGTLAMGATGRGRGRRVDGQAATRLRMAGGAIDAVRPQLQLGQGGGSGSSGECWN